MARMGEDKMSGLQKSAILLIALGPEKSASIFKHLKEEEIEELTLEIANTRSVTPQIKEGVIEEFYQVCLAQQYIAEGGIGYAKELVEKALGAEKAMDVPTARLIWFRSPCPINLATITLAPVAMPITKLVIRVIRVLHTPTAPTAIPSVSKVFSTVISTILNSA